MSYYYLFQYQQLAEPFSAALVAPETVTLDKWFTGPVVPVRTPARVPSSHGEFLFDSSLFDTVSLDKWFAPSPLPLPLPRRAAGTDGAALFDPSLFVVPETVTLDKWFAESRLPIWGRWTPAGLGGALGVDPTLMVEVPAQLSWMMAPVLPRRRTTSENIIHVFEPTLPLAEIITLDKWFVPSLLPFRARRMAPWTYGGWLVDPSILSLAAGPAACLDHRRPDPPCTEHRSADVTCLDQSRPDPSCTEHRRP